MLSFCSLNSLLILNSIRFLLIILRIFLIVSFDNIFIIHVRIKCWNIKSEEMKLLIVLFLGALCLAQVSVFITINGK